MIGDMVLGGKKGAAGAGSLSALGATPVYVVNMPNGGLGGPDVNFPDNKKPNKSLFNASNLANIPLIGWASYELADLTDSVLSSNFDGYREADAKFTTKMKAFFGDKEAQAQDVQYYGADPAKYEVKPMSPPEYMTGGDNRSPISTPSSYLAAQAGEMKLKVEVSDDRVKVTPTYLPKGFSVDPDTGIN
ncbi:methyl-accepting chemotaxis protein [Vibrio cholerae CP1044(17)]|nr:methyl-accepting chemotaxis protein [Vibrio cholerae CP1030(3)]EKG69256.1 methyl-accepting chemotaxis protein [Vibrio cholerae CP1040(13)]EKG78118.1 methyl-accepting chemotaxis protein [Vibrio cholerae CP1044(17)]